VGAGGLGCLRSKSLRLPSRRRRCTSSLAAAPSAMRKRGESPQGRYPRIEPVSFLGNPVSRRGTRALAFSEAPRISCRAKVDKQKPVLISRGLHPIPLCFAIERVAARLGNTPPICRQCQRRAPLGAPPLDRVGPARSSRIEPVGRAGSSVKTSSRRGNSRSSMRVRQPRK
jgi:hypothetical protein